MSNPEEKQPAVNPKENPSTEDSKDKGPSKSELKKQAKLEKLAKEKAEKDAKKKEKEETQPKIAKKEKEVAEEEILDPVLYYESRCKVISHLKGEQKSHPYPHKFQVTHSIEAFRKKYDPICVENNVFLNETVSIAGRITNIRTMGANLIFYDLQGDGLKLQAVVNSSTHEGEMDFKTTHHYIRRGDIIGVRGNPGRTKTGELSIKPGLVKLLSACLHMLPTQITGLKDQETRYRQRYLDLIMNNRTREIFITRTKIIKYMKNYLDDLGFLEVFLIYSFFYICKIRIFLKLIIFLVFIYIIIVFKNIIIFSHIPFEFLRVIHSFFLYNNYAFINYRLKLL